MGAGDGFGHGRQRGIDRALELQAVAEDADLQVLSLVGAGEDRTGRWEARMGLAPRPRRRRGGSRGWHKEGRARWRQAQVGVVAQFGGALAGALGQVAFGQGLQPPGDPPDQPDFVANARRVIEEFGVTGAQSGDDELPERSEFVSQVGVHAVLLFPVVEPLTPVSPVRATRSREIAAPRRGILPGAGTPPRTVAEADAGRGLTL